MKIVAGIASGNRKESVMKVVEAWESFGIATSVITWDADTYEVLTSSYKFGTGHRHTYAENHNMLMKFTPGWDVYICGNDDTFPVLNIWLIEKLAEKFPGHVLTPNEGHLARCFPIITRGWYEAHHPSFDEGYVHNCTEFDLDQQAASEGKFINCPLIVFEHRHVIPQGYEGITQSNSNNFKSDVAKYRAKWKGKPYNPEPSLIVREL